MTSDSTLQQAVLAELKWEPSVVAAHIGVAANAGVVTLTGHVENFDQKQAAEAAVLRVKGVKAIAEELEVRLPFGNTRTDDEIAAAALNRLSWDVAVPPDSVIVTARNGWVTLTGEVSWDYQRHSAAHDIARLFGVVGVSNMITIKPVVDVANLSDDITHALHRSYFFDPKTVFVSAEAGRVRLTGTVGSLHDKAMAAQAAWGGRGVTAVENDITIS
jgi:osmotically-inducible protein OsmY